MEKSKAGAAGNTEKTISSGTLREWMEQKEPVFVLDVRPPAQREEWYIPGSHYLDAYKRLKEGDVSVLDELEIPENTKVITVCAEGRTSRIAAEALRKKGRGASSLQGGMKAWSTAWNSAGKQFRDFDLWQIRRTGKGCLSYVLASGRRAVILDASLPVAVYEKIVRRHNLAVKYVLETHIHADHLSRSRLVAEHFHVPLFLPGPNQVQFAFREITADTAFSIGAAKLRVMPTPGHTPESVSFYIEDQAVFTGDTLFTEGVGRPDLKAGPEESRHKAGLLYESLQRLLSLPGKVQVLPAHTGKPVAFDGELVTATIREVKTNLRLPQRNRTDFIQSLLQKIPEPPANHLSIVERNLAGDFSDIDPSDLEAGANRCAV